MLKHSEQSWVITLCAAHWPTLLRLREQFLLNNMNYRLPNINSHSCLVYGPVQVLAESTA